MNFLFIHQNFPGQFIHLTGNLATNEKHRVVALTMRDNPAPKNVQVRRYSLLRSPAAETHPMLRDEEAKVMRAEACAAAALQLKREGFVPDVIVAHPGWGEALFIKDVFPKAKLVIYCEYYYAAEGQDVGFDPSEPPLSFQQRCRLRLKNTTNLLSLEIADAAISPTEWQKSTFPEWAQEKITVIHDGIDADRLQFKPNASIKLANRTTDAKVLRPTDEVLTYVARNLEPVRGFPNFMRSLPSVLTRRPKAQVVIVGGDEVSYGRPPTDGLTWREHMLREIGDDLDRTRVHFVGKIAYQSYIDLLHVSSVHAYWTTPFVLSWSFLEASVAGTTVVASATPPVSEFSNRLGTATFEFFDTAKCVDLLAENLSPKPKRKQVLLRDLNISECIRRQTRLLTE